MNQQVQKNMREWNVFLATLSDSEKLVFASKIEITSFGDELLEKWSQKDDDVEFQDRDLVDFAKFLEEIKEMPLELRSAHCAQIPLTTLMAQEENLIQIHY